MSPSSTIVIEIKEVSKKYHNKSGIQNINAKFTSGQLNLLVGKNGSGKTTLLKCIMGVVRYQGKIIKNRFVIGYAPEDYVMPYFMSVNDFLRSIGKIKDCKISSLENEISELLDYFGLTEYANRHFGALSNGMRQKVNLIQAFLNRPKTIILDEPLHGLDQESQRKIMKLIKERVKESLVLISTHYPELYKTRKKSLYMMEEGVLYDCNYQTAVSLSLE